LEIGGDQRRGGFNRRRADEIELDKANVEVLGTELGC
jgi:hypothetical protein